MQKKFSLILSPQSKPQMLNVCLSVCIDTLLSSPTSKSLVNQRQTKQNMQRKAKMLKKTLRLSNQNHNHMTRLSARAETKKRRKERREINELTRRHLLLDSLKRHRSRLISGLVRAETRFEKICEVVGHATDDMTNGSTRAGLSVICCGSTRRYLTSAATGSRSCWKIAR